MKTTLGKKEITTYTQTCDICGKDITGFSQVAVEFHMKAHKGAKHPERIKKKVSK